MKRTQLWYLIGATLLAVYTAKADSYTVTAPPGMYTPIANQLDNPGGTSLDVLLPIVPDGCEVYIWDCAIQNFNSTPYTYWTFLGGWTPAGGTLGPGEGALFYNNGTTDINLTFVGTARASAPASLPCGCGKLNLVSCVTATIGTYENITGKLASEGAVFARWDRNLFDWVYNTYSGGFWSPGSPTANVGESVLVNVPCNAPSYKWYQPPALGGGPTNIFNGWNQRSMTNLPPIAADDWVCSTTNPVTKVVWWGSFLNWTYSNPPVLPQGFQIKFWSDVPKGTDPIFPDFSHPGFLVAPEIYVAISNYQCTYYGQDLDPRNGQYEACFRYEANLARSQWFYQTTNAAMVTNIYWLSIAADMSNVTGYEWGWKTRPYTNSAPDAAVMFDPDVSWYHPIFFPTPTNMWDLAFELGSSYSNTLAKWEQLPDLSYNGMDVNATMFPAVPPPAPPYLLADDFQCTTTGPITNITIWGSWFHDYHDYSVGPSNISIVLSIHDDIPAYSPPYYSPWSMPGAVKWCRTNSPAQYKCSVYATGLYEGWLDPPSSYNPMGDFTCFQYNFNFTPAQAFIQQGSPSSPITYWLDVQARLPGSPVSQVRFGWKTSPEHWNDAATWVNAFEQYTGPWQQLLYPPGHQLENQNVDMAFRLNPTGQQYSQTKWTQPPVPVTVTNAYNGWDEYSVFTGTNIVADDWVCTNAAPVTDIHWWGSFIGWGDTNPPPQMPNAFIFSIWSDVPRGTGVPFSHPGVCLTNIYCPSFTMVPDGWDYDPRNPNAPPDACFKFQQDLLPEQWFRQAPGTNTYWISIAAQYIAGPVVDYPFGWKTRPRDTNSLAPDDAVRIFYPTAPAPGAPYQSGTNIWWPTTNSSWDMAFALTTYSNACGPPTLICTNLTVQCGTGAWGPPFVWDNCCNALLIPTQTGSVTNGYCPWVITETWGATDCTGQSNWCNRVVNVVDSLPPNITCATNKTVVCGLAWSFDPPTASDICCGTNVAVTVVGTTTNGYCPWVIIRTWKATDCCSNTATCSQTVTIVDTNPPAITCGTNKTVVCGLAWDFDPPSASDTCCGTNVSIIVVGTTTNGYCPWLITRTWKATDCCSNSMTCSQTVTLVDTNPPSITCGTNKTVVCGLQWSFDAPTATDTCCGTNVAVTVVSTITNGYCPWLITRTWKATDCCSNLMTCSQTVTVVDTNPPSITCGTNKTVVCGSQWSFEAPAASDACCGTNVTVNIVSTVTNGYCPWIITRTWQATDCCSNTSAPCSQTVTMVDTNPPSLTCGTNKTVQCGSAWDFDPPSASDACCGTNVSVIVVGTTTNGICPWVVTRTWKATDCCSNTATCSQTVSIVDTLAPTITCASNKTVECGSAWSFDLPSASDICCGTNVTIALVSTTTNGYCPWLITRTWRAIDCCSNTAFCSQTVTVQDTTPPTITCASNKTVAAGWPWSFDLPSATDACCTVTIRVISTLTNLPCPLTVTRAWAATDCCSNSATCSQTVTVVNTNLPPADTDAVKFVQWPKTVGGYDVYDRTFMFLADDFLCTNTGPITDIHIWCSYMNDMVTNPPIWLGIYSDVPATVNSNSHPGRLLWQQTFMPDQYRQYFWSCGAERFIAPGVDYGPESQVLYYVFYPTNTFVQQGSPQYPTTYWLAVYCLDFSLFGWKTSTNSFQDAAVWGPWTGDPGSATTWQPMKDPLFGEPLNMAFKITTTTNPVPSSGVKFTQPPDLSTNGFDVRALRPKILADDFLCIKSGPITNIHLWASWLYDYPDTNAAFQLGFWSDVPITAGLGASQLYNGTFELTFTNASTNGPLDGLADSIPPGWYRYETFSGGGKENSYIGPAADNGPSAPGSQAVMFSRTAGHTSGDWTAIYQPLAINAGLYSHLYLTMDVRVWSHNLPAGGWVAPAFEWPAVVEIDYVDNTGHNQIWRHGWYLNPPGDDDGSPINDPGQGLIPFYNDTLVPEGVWTPNNFDLFAELPRVQTITRILVGGAGWDFFSEVDNVSIRASSTNAFSRPGNLLWSRVFAPGQYSYNSYPGELQPYYDPNLGSNGLIGSEMQVWQYDFPVLTNAAFRQTNGTVYWLSVSVNSQDYFGWKTAANRWNDDAVFGHVDNGWLPLRDWQELFDPTGTRSLDLAFSLTTEGMLLKVPVITNIVCTNQFTTNLVFGFAWTWQPNVSYQVFSTTDLGASPILWSPCGPEINAPNHWYWETNTLTRQKFYRVLAIDP